MFKDCVRSLYNASLSKSDSYPYGCLHKIDLASGLINPEAKCHNQTIIRANIHMRSAVSMAGTVYCLLEAAKLLGRIATSGRKRGGRRLMLVVLDFAV